MRKRAGFAILSMAAFLAAAGGSGCRDQFTGDAAAISVGLDEPGLMRQIEKLRKENEKLQTRIDKLVPKDCYIVVNTTENRIYLRRGDEVLVDAICSTGSNTLLTAPDGQKSWFFSTPRGVFKVRSRLEDPVWVRPDWAFIEEGEQVPPARANERYEEGVLGDYALYFGNGYMIHGTLFQRFLGLNVTHGCIRVGDDDLQKIWEKTKIGTPIYIF